MARDSDALLLQVSADIRGLEKQFAKASGIVNAGSRKMQKDAQGISAALDSIFDNTRLKVFDTGAARIGIFGSSLEKLGPAGLGAAAAIGLVAAALHQAGEAIAFADDLDDTANRLHITTDALQEYRYALRLAGGEEKGADEALEAFSVTLGKAQLGLAKSQRGFSLLGFTPEQVKAFRDTDQALTAVVAKLAGIKDDSRRDALISLLGLDKMKPLIAGGVDEMTRLRDEARKAGVVMDAELVKRGAEAHDEFETLTKVVKVQLMSAFVDLGPVLIGLMQTLANMAKFAGEIADNFRSIENRRASSLKKQEADLLKDNERLKGVLGREPNNAVAKGLIDRNVQILSRLQIEMASRDAKGTGSSAPPNTSIAVPGAGKVARSRGTAKAAPGYQGGPIVPDDLRKLLEMGAKIEIAVDVDPLEQVVEEAGELRDVFGNINDINEAAAEAAVASAQQYKSEWESTFRGVQDGIYAITDGNALQYLGERLRRTPLDNLASGLTDALMSLGGGSGFLSKAISAGSSLLGFHAGGSNSFGGLTRINEAGPEGVAFLPKNTQIIPNSVLRGLAQLKNLPGHARNTDASRITMRMEVNVVGAIGRDGIAAIARREAMAGAQAAINASRKGAKGVQGNLALLGTP